MLPLLRLAVVTLNSNPQQEPRTGLAQLTGSVTPVETETTLLEEFPQGWGSVDWMEDCGGYEQPTTVGTSM